MFALWNILICILCAVRPNLSHLSARNHLFWDNRLDSMALACVGGCFHRILVIIYNCQKTIFHAKTNLIFLYPAWEFEVCLIHFDGCWQMETVLAQYAPLFQRGGKTMKNCKTRGFWVTKIQLENWHGRRCERWNNTPQAPIWWSNMWTSANYLENIIIFQRTSSLAQNSLCTNRSEYRDREPLGPYRSKPANIGHAIKPNFESIFHAKDRHSTSDFVWHCFCLSIAWFTVTSR